MLSIYSTYHVMLLPTTTRLSPLPKSYRGQATREAGCVAGYWQPVQRRSEASILTWYPSTCSSLRRQDSQQWTPQPPSSCTHLGSMCHWSLVSQKKLSTFSRGCQLQSSGGTLRLFWEVPAHSECNF